MKRAAGVDVLVTVVGAPLAPRIEAWTRILLSKAGAKRPLPLSILLCGDRRMRTLNRAWRGRDVPTDVLSFSSGEKEFLGDIVIDVPYAARQARRRGHALAREVQILLAHGLLHLLGYDHEEDDGTMFRLQRRILLAAFGEGPDGVP
ncbi:MAG: rRNA maturation RNase YbeY [Acidobacteriota bacterium]|nr:rRNA maturation RNase YbeY [Acidobacteriota bacterium]